MTTMEQRPSRDEPAAEFDNGDRKRASNEVNAEAGHPMGGVADQTETGMVDGSVVGVVGGAGTGVVGESVVGVADQAETGMVDGSVVGVVGGAGTGVVGESVVGVVGGAGTGVIGRAEAVLMGFAGRFGVPALRVTLALTFLWFGALKVTNDTPVGDFVANTVSWVPGLSGSWFVPFLGVVEVLLGAALLVGRGLRVVLPLLFAHLAGTFLALVTQPDVTFQGGNPAMLTTEGEFVIKNLILLSAVLVLYGLQRVKVARS